MRLRQTPLVKDLINVGIRLTEDIRDASDGSLSDECCATIAAGIIARDTEGAPLYDALDDDDLSDPDELR